MKKMMGWMIVFLLLITLIPVKQAEASTGHHTVNVKTTLNVRENPSPRAKVVGSLKNGAVVYVYNIEPGGWSKIKYNNKAGYVASGYLTPNGSSSNPGGVQATVKTSPSVAVRANPSPKAKIIGSLKKGASTYVYGSKPGGWSEIRYNNKPAYVATSALDIKPNMPSSFTAKYPKETVLDIKHIDLDKDRQNETVILSKQGNLFWVKGNTVTQAAKGIKSDNGYPAAKLTIFNPVKSEYQIVTTYEYGPSNTQAAVYRMQKGSLVRILNVMGDQGIRLSTSVIYQDWKKYRNGGGWDKVTAVYTWDNKKQRFTASGVRP